MEVSPLVFFKGLALALGWVILCIFGVALLIWLMYMFKKIFPDWVYWTKYNIFRKKTDPKLIDALRKEYESGISENGLMKKLLIDHNLPIGKAKEMR